MTTIQFDRIGRHHNLTTNTSFEDPAIIDDIERFASGYLLAKGSPAICVYENGRVSLGHGRYGTGKIIDASV